MRRVVVSIILLLMPLTGLLAQYRYTDVAFTAGEYLEYDVGYKWSFINKYVAKASFATKTQYYYGTPHYFVTAQARVNSSFRWFFDMHDVYLSIMDTVDLRPKASTAELKEGNYRFSSRFEYDWQENKVKTYARNHRRNNERQKEMPLTAISFDGLSLFYNLRSTEMDKLYAGDYLHLVLDDTIRTIKYRFLGREERDIPKMGRFKTLKFSCEMATSTGESFEDGSEFYMWVSDDKNKIPLYFESPVRIGKVRARLSKFSGLRYPLSSKIE